MSDPTPLPSIERIVKVPVPPARAFDHFVADFGRWWPRDYTWAGEKLATITIQPRLNGRCTETGPHGFRLDWGRVLAWEPPHLLRFTWQIDPDRVPQPDPDRASVVNVRFSVVPAGAEAGWTEVALAHSGFERHGRGGAAYRAALDGRGGWTHLLALYAGYCG